MKTEHALGQAFRAVALGPHYFTRSLAVAGLIRTCQLPSTQPFSCKRPLLARKQTDAQPQRQELSWSSDASSTAIDDLLEAVAGIPAVPLNAQVGTAFHCQDVRF